jgi:DNA-binding SARP family transcriptional activator
MGSPGIRIDVLGGFRVSVEGRAVTDDVWRRRKPAALLKILVLSPGQRLHREQLIDLLWPDMSLAAAGPNLRKAIFHVRSALDGVVVGAGALLAFEGDVVALPASQLTLDMTSFRLSLAAARRAGEVDDYRSALSWYGGELLPDDRYDDWAVGPRRELHEEYLAGLSEMAALLEASGDLDAATETARLLVAAEPTREESHATLIRLYAFGGRRGDALRQYENLVRVLDDELGVEPGPEVQRLHEEIRARRADEPELTAQLWERVGDLRMLSGDAVGAAKAFGQALDAGGAPSASGRLGRKCAEAWLMQHRPDVAAGHLDTADREANELAEKGRILRARANHAWETGDLASAQSFAQQSRELAVEHGTAEDLAAAQEAVAIASHFQGEWRQGLESELERLASGPDVTQLARVFDIHHCIGQYHLYGDGLADSVEGYARGILDRAEDVGAVRAQAFAWCLLGESLLLQGRWDESDGCLERSCHLHESFGSRSGALPWQRRAELAACRGRYNEVDVCLRRASGIATVSAMASHLWGRIYATAALAAIERGEPDEAVRAVQAAAAASARYGDCPTCSALLNPVAAEAFARLADPGNARAYGTAATRVAGYFNSSAWRAMAASAAGSVAAAEGDRSAARACFEDAQGLYERAGQPFWAQRCARSAETAVG